MYISEPSFRLQGRQILVAEGNVVRPICPVDVAVTDVDDDVPPPRIILVCYPSCVSGKVEYRHNPLVFPVQHICSFGFDLLVDAKQLNGRLVGFVSGILGRSKCRWMGIDRSLSDEAVSVYFSTDL